MADQTFAVPEPGRAGHLVARICACGQDLDVLHGKHCPRCGITLRTRHGFAPAA